MTRAATNPDRREEFAGLQQALMQSTIASGARWAERAGRAAFIQSRLRAAWISVSQSWHGLPPPHRLRLTGSALLSFVIVHTTLLLWVPGNVAPAMPSGVWLIVALLGVLLIAAPNALVRAWQARRGPS